MLRFFISIVSLIALLSGVSSHALAETTQVMVRALANDAKLIGTSMGGARVIISESATGQVLAEGITEGGTGDTTAIMSTPYERGTLRYATDKAAGYLASVQISEPTQVDIMVTGPLDYPQAQTMARQRLLLIPGQDILGEGVVLRLNGFVVEILTPEDSEPSPNDDIDVARLETTEVNIMARVRMLCGCPTQPGGMWDSDAYSMQARLISEDGVVATSAVEYSGKTSHFSAQLSAPKEGSYLLELLVSDPGKGNFGRVTRTLVIGEQ